jgi:16S rRNA (guanine527-N7)-methyltransferase
MSRQHFKGALSLPDETMARFDAYAELLAKWQQKMNLIGPGTAGEAVWRRHFLDSAQLMRHITGPSAAMIDISESLAPGTALARPAPANGHARVVVDLGSGAGFPGLVLAILGAGEVHLIESNTRKAAFLLEAVRVTRTTGVHVHMGRIEDVQRFPADIVTARALAPVEKLLPWASRFWTPVTRALFLKGAGLGEELTAAEALWQIEAVRHPSRTDPDAAILEITGFREV